MSAQPAFRIVSLRLSSRAGARTEQVAEDPIPEGRVVEVQPILLSVEQASKALSVGRTEVFRLLREQRLRSIKRGRRRLIPRAELDRYVEEEMKKDQ